MSLETTRFPSSFAIILICHCPWRKTERASWFRTRFQDSWTSCYIWVVHPTRRILTSLDGSFPLKMDQTIFQSSMYQYMAGFCTIRGLGSQKSALLGEDWGEFMRRILGDVGLRGWRRKIMIWNSTFLLCTSRGTVGCRKRSDIGHTCQSAKKKLQILTQTHLHIAVWSNVYI